MGVFDRSGDSKRQSAKIQGLLGYFGLGDWWLSAFTEEQRSYIEKKVRFVSYGVSVSLESTDAKTGADPRPLTQGTYLNIFKTPGERQTAAEFLGEVSTQFWGDDLHLAIRMVEKANSLLDLEGEAIAVLGRHFAYNHIIDVYYKTRHDNPANYEALVTACKKQIPIASEAIKAWRTQYPYLEMIGHPGFDHMATVLEQQQDYAAAMRLCEEAKQQGWQGDWDKRIELYRALQAWLAEYPHLALPHYVRFVQMAIALEKQGDYAAAIRFCEEAKEEGWQGDDWDKRIARCKSKAGKPGNE